MYLCFCLLLGVTLNVFGGCLAESVLEATGEVFRSGEPCSIGHLRNIHPAGQQHLASTFHPDAADEVGGRHVGLGLQLPVKGCLANVHLLQQLSQSEVAVTDMLVYDFNDVIGKTMLGSDDVDFGLGYLGL